MVEKQGIMMENYQEQYNQELHQQEINSNLRTLKGFFWIVVTMLVLWLLTLTRIFIVDAGIFTMAVGLSMVMGIPVLYIYKKVDLSKHWVKYVFLTLICVISAIFAAFLSFHAVLIYVLPLLLAVQYRKKQTLWITYAVNDVTMTISMVAGFYHGICDLNLFLGSNHTRDWYLEQWEAGTLQFGVEPDPLFVILFYGALPRAVILLMFTVILCYISISSHEDAQKIADLTYRKETDLGTHEMCIRDRIISYQPVGCTGTGALLLKNGRPPRRTAVQSEQEMCDSTSYFLTKYLRMSNAQAKRIMPPLMAYCRF